MAKKKENKTIWLSFDEWEDLGAAIDSACRELEGGDDSIEITDIGLKLNESDKITFVTVCYNSTMHDMIERKI